MLAPVITIDRADKHKSVSLLQRHGDKLEWLLFYESLKNGKTRIFVANPAALTQNTSTEKETL